MCTWVSKKRGNTVLRLAGIHAELPGFCRERVTIPAERAFPVPDELSDEQACLGGEVATAVHLLRVGDVGDGTALGVVGAGRHGRHVIRLAGLLGASRVVISCWSGGPSTGAGSASATVA